MSPLIFTVSCNNSLQDKLVLWLTTSLFPRCTVQESCLSLRRNRYPEWLVLLCMLLSSAGCLYNLTIILQQFFNDVCLISLPHTHSSISFSLFRQFQSSRRTFPKYSHRPQWIIKLEWKNKERNLVEIDHTSQIQPCPDAALRTEPANTSLTDDLTDSNNPWNLGYAFWTTDLNIVSLFIHWANS